MEFKPLSEIKEFFTRYADGFGIEIVDVESNATSATLTCYIETADGVDLDTCEKFHNAVMDPIDELDPSYGAPYTLNISSPGLDRPFKCARDFERNIGKEVEVKLYAPVKGKKFLTGTLRDFDDNTVTVEINGETLKLQKNKIAKINKAIIFD